MNKIIRFTLLFVVLTVGIVSTSSTQLTTRASGVKPPTLFGCPLPIPNCIPEDYFDFKTCRCVPRP